MTKRVVLTLLLLAACGTAPLPGAIAPTATARPEPSPSNHAAVAPGCGPGTPPVADDSFIPYAGRFGYGYEGPLLGRAKRVASLDEAHVGFPVLLPRVTARAGSLQAILLASQRVTLVYATTPLSDGETLAELMARGGLLVSEQPQEGIDRAADAMVELGKRGALVEIGPFLAAWGHGDPIRADELRTYNLYWNDGTRDWSVRSGPGDPAHVINVARSIYC